MKKKLFDVKCPVGRTTTGILHGKTSGVINLEGLKYQWAYDLWEKMLANTWFAKEVDMTRDASDYKVLLPVEKKRYDRIMAQLIFMDGVQTNNTPDNVNSWITAPEINICIVRQAMEEALHSQAYGVMVQSISTNTNEIFEMWREDQTLFNKNKHILDVYEKYGEIAESDDEAKIYMIVANQCLEGIYFYSGFAGMYSFARNGKMIGSSEMIRFIQRDEIAHLTLFANIFKEIRKEFPHLFTERVLENVREMFKAAAELEITWGKYITEGGILGLSPALIEEFIKYLTNKRLEELGLPVIYEGVSTSDDRCPLPWFYSFSSFNDQKINFFEGNVVNYSKGSLDMNF